MPFPSPPPSFLNSPTELDSHWLALRAGSTHMLQLTEGSELFCSAGDILLNSGPQALVDSLPQLQWRLQQGQSWRAPCSLQVQIQVVSPDTVQLRCQMAATPSQSQGLRTSVVAAWRRLLGDRSPTVPAVRQRNASST